MRNTHPWDHGPLRVSANGRFFEHTDGTPFFWLGDTGWLLFTRLDLEGASRYLDDRSDRGFNVIQVMLVHRLPTENAYREKLESLEAISLRVRPSSSARHSYFAVVDQMIRLAEDRGLYMAIVPVWGSVVQEGHLDESQAREYGAWLGSHYRDRPNIIWLNGGDIRGTVRPEVWNALGSSIKEHDPEHLMTFHPFGRTQSSRWFHRASWLDFNMFQSGHRRYDQRSLTPTGGANADDPDEEADWKGEDNWRYVLEDLATDPPKPTVDGEPSYEGIPQGLHDQEQPRWKAADARRYAWWATLAGAAGHTYGNNEVMQMYSPEYPAAYGASRPWEEAILDPGADQMRHLRALMETVRYGEGREAPEIIVGDVGERYHRLLASAGPRYALVYAYTPQEITLDLDAVEGIVNSGSSGRQHAAVCTTARWYDPATGTGDLIGVVELHGRRRFTPQRPPGSGNDVVLVLQSLVLQSKEE